MDKEIEAMSSIIKALEGLESEAVERVIGWVSQRYRLAVKSATPGVATLQGTQVVAPAVSLSGDDQAFSAFHELFDAANPSTAIDKALVCAYWFQVCRGSEDFDSQQINTELKHLGHPSTNITRDFDNLIGRTPRLVIQVRKDGTTKQARKKYKLTREGEKAVIEMLKKSPEATD